MRILAIDYGTKNIGLAISDETLTLAREMDEVGLKDFWSKLEELVSQYEIGKVLVGLPIGLSGQETASTKKVLEFIKKLKNVLTVEIEEVDERFTTDLAKRMRGGRGHHDSLVAQILLQDHLDRLST